MRQYVLHPSVVGWWLPYDAYADDSLRFLDELSHDLHRAIVIDIFPLIVIAKIEAAQSDCARAGLDSGPAAVVDRSAIQIRLNALKASGNLREVMLNPLRNPQQMQFIQRIEQLSGVSRPDATLICPAIRAQVPLLVADCDVYIAA